MKISICIELDDNSTPYEIGFALREAGKHAGENVRVQGSFNVDEERRLPLLNSMVKCVCDASVFRSE